MKTIILDRARYTVRDDRHTFLSDVLKLTGKHKPVKPKGGCERRYPADGADANLVGFYEGLSDRLTVPMGEDSMEVCHED